MTSEDFLAEILARPDDDLPRLIYADWLEEHGDPRSEFIRVQCELARLSRAPERWEGMYRHSLPPHAQPEKTVRSARSLPRYRELLARETSLLLAHCGAWAAPFGSKITGVIFSRGFIEGCSTRAITYAENAADWYRITPIRQLRIIHIYEHIGLLLESRFLRHVHTLEFDCTGRQIQDHEALLLAACPNLANLRHLDPGSNLTERGIRAVLDSPYLQQLQTFVVQAQDNSVLQSELDARFGPAPTW